ncbi:hypothetical protein M422DRAFT_50517 [Sphaerobolus stellatus SS14]|uniref:Uncharacterized protein n=1 Tax=Sphaerobolus stellatus (strain SS14) TaxID=990650 RepID=A0A0C9URN0_SPHS4|nr:hypothetical protein M422DRAFT_50517 [Sphaerobolus stellatus SS14]
MRPKIYILYQLSSSGAYIASRTKAVESLEQLLAEICASDKTTELEIFLKLQDGFQCNVASLPCTALNWLPTCWDKLLILQEPLVSSTLSLKYEEIILVEKPGPDAASLSQLIIQLFCVLQEVSLLHSPSKVFLGKKWCIQLFIDLLAISKHLYPSPPSSTAKTLSKPSSPNANLILASSTIDVLLTFEEIGGVEVVVKTLKRTGVPRDIQYNVFKMNIKCLEFLHSYLLDETDDIPSINLKTDTPINRSSSEEGFSPQKSSSAVSRSSSSPEVPRTPRNP